MSATGNADPNELAKFSALAQSWWDPLGPSKPLHDLNPLRLRYIEQALALRDARVVDVGCGGGILSEAMARRGASVLGIDLSQAVLDVGGAARHREQSGARISIDRSRGVGRGPPKRLRLGHLHGNARTRTGSGSDACRAGNPGEAGRPHHRIDLEPQTSGIRARHSGRRVRRADVAARHARVFEIHPTVRTCPLGTDGGSRRSSTSPGSATTR